MLAGGIVGDRSKHATMVADFAFAMHAGAKLVRAPNSGEPLNIRVGAASHQPLSPASMREEGGRQQGRPWWGLRSWKQPQEEEGAEAEEGEEMCERCDA